MDNKLRFSNPTKFELTPGADGKQPTLSGYAIVWGAITSDSRKDKKGAYQVRIMPNSATFSNPTFGLLNHNYDNVLASTSNQTLRMSSDNVGVKFEMDMPDTQVGRDTAYNVANGLISGVSFSAIPTDYHETFENGNRIINFKAFKSDEVTITPVPAFQQSSVGIKDSLTMSAVGEDTWDFSATVTTAEDNETDVAATDNKSEMPKEDYAAHQANIDAKYRAVMFTFSLAELQAAETNDDTK